jgi:Putative zinc-finger
MSRCDELLRQIEAGAADEWSAELAEHLSGCAACQLAVDRLRGLDDGAHILRDARASESLKIRLKSVTRLTPACERAQELVGIALDGELETQDRTELLAHLHDCPSCQATWDAFATLREVGAQTHLTPRFRAALAIAPSHRIAVRRRPRVFDLRLATAAAYLLAAATVLLLSNPATVARASSDRIERAQVYAQAVVENRITSYSRQVFEAGAAATGWAHDNALQLWSSLRKTFGSHTENPKPGNRVVKSGDGGRP